MCNIPQFFIGLIGRLFKGAVPSFDEIAPVLGISLIAFAVLFIVLPFLLSAVIGHFLYAIAFLRFTKSRPDLKRFWVWVPLANTPNAMYLTENLTGMEDFHLFGDKIVLTSKKAYNLFLILWIVALVLVGARVPLLPTLCFVVLYFMEYAYLRNLINFLFPNREEENRKKLIIIMILNLFTYGFARPVYLFILSKKYMAQEQTESEEPLESVLDSCTDETLEN